MLSITSFKFVHVSKIFSSVGSHNFAKNKLEIWGSGKKLIKIFLIIFMADSNRMSLSAEWESILIYGKSNLWTLSNYIERMGKCMASNNLVNFTHNELLSFGVPVLECNKIRKKF